jgi:hypothetical protein
VQSCAPGTSPVNGHCSKTTCSSSCKTCSLDGSFCLTCPDDKPINDIKSGKCVSDKIDGCDRGYYVNTVNKTCSQCSGACSSCAFSASQCTSCWNFYESNILNWVDFSCVKTCPNSTYYDKTLNTCQLCNPICNNCTGPEPTDCITCNKTT